jgi:hypothetical protein
MRYVGFASLAIRHYRQQFSFYTKYISYYRIILGILVRAAQKDSCSLINWRISIISRSSNRPSRCYFHYHTSFCPLSRHRTAFSILRICCPDCVVGNCSLDLIPCFFRKALTLEKTARIKRIKRRKNSKRRTLASAWDQSRTKRANLKTQVSRSFALAVTNYFTLCTPCFSDRSTVRYNFCEIYSLCPVVKSILTGLVEFALIDSIYFSRWTRRHRWRLYNRLRYVAQK